MRLILISKENQQYWIITDELERNVEFLMHADETEIKFFYNVTPSKKKMNLQAILIRFKFAYS